MEIKKAQEFLQDNHRGVLTTYRRDGRLQMSPILIGVNAEGLGIISSRETAYKVKNLRRDPRAYGELVRELNALAEQLQQ